MMDLCRPGGFGSGDRTRYYVHDDVRFHGSFPFFHIHGLMLCIFNVQGSNCPRLYWGAFTPNMVWISL